MDSYKEDLQSAYQHQKEIIDNLPSMEVEQHEAQRVKLRFENIKKEMEKLKVPVPKGKKKNLLDELENEDDKDEGNVDLDEIEEPSMK